jgi:hypothetical protein
MEYWNNGKLGSAAKLIRFYAFADTTKSAVVMRQ